MTILARFCVAIGLLSAMAAHADSSVRVELDTRLGPIIVEVDLEHAPISAAEFLRYVDASLYNGGSLYRVVRTDNDHGPVHIEVIQGGLATPERALPPIAHETTKQTGIHHTDGVISLARRELGTAQGMTHQMCTRCSGAR
jgi:peptidyl-prolyl cis-trans isomerase A (cyclophilin A)